MYHCHNQSGSGDCDETHADGERHPGPIYCVRPAVVRIPTIAADEVDRCAQCDVVVKARHPRRSKIVTEPGSTRAAGAATYQALRLNAGNIRYSQLSHASAQFGVMTIAGIRTSNQSCRRSGRELSRSPRNSFRRPAESNASRRARACLSLPIPHQRD